MMVIALLIIKTSIVILCVILSLIILAAYLFDSEIERLLTKHQEFNKIYICKHCGRFQRKWQFVLHELMHDEKVCIHCGVEKKDEDVTRTVRKATKEELKPWVYKDGDCPELSKLEFIKKLILMRKLKKVKEEMHSVDSFMEYDKKRKTSYWQKKDLD